MFSEYFVLLPSNSAVSLFVRSESRHHLLRPQIMKLSLSFIRRKIKSSKIYGFERLSFIKTQHVSFMLQAFRLNDTCRCITTSTSITQPRNYTCGTSTVFYTVWVVGTWHHRTAGTSALGMIWTTSTTTFHTPLLDLRNPVVPNWFNNAPLIALLGRSHNFTDLLHDLNILRRHTVHPRGEPAQRLPQLQLWIVNKLFEMQYNRHFHDLFTWLKLYPKHLLRNCLHLRLIVWTQ